MTQDPDRLFRRYQKTRDPELLARVFDATAPQLLRLAIHLAGDAAEAEDLVQATFLAAIKRAETYAGESPVQGWLAGILSNKAKDARRRAARDIDPERLPDGLIGRAVATPLEEAEQAECSGELAKAIDALDDTYRQAVVLRLRHGMKTADIAHVLELSPGAVRVRLSRGMEKLRQALPVGLASAVFLAVTPERGLAAVREVVVAEANAAAVLVTGTSTITLGGLLMTNKVLLGTVTLVVALAAAAWLRNTPETRGGDPVAEPTPSAAAKPLEPALAAAEAPTGPAGPPRTEVLEAATEEGLVRLRGIVLDEATGEPLSGARVDVHAPQRMSYSELKERAHPYVRQQNWRGELRTYASWPWFGGTDRFGLPTDAQRLDASELLVFDRPDARDEASLTTYTDQDGRFDIRVPAEGGTLVCSLSGFGERIVPVALPEEEWSIALRRAGLVAGHVIDEEGQPIEQVVELLFYGDVGKGWGVNSETGAVGETDGREAWPVSTAPDGSFEVHLPGQRVQVEILTPGLLMQMVGHHPDHGDWIFKQSFEPGKPNLCACGEEAPVRIVARRVPILHVVDDATGEGIEHFQMVGRELANGYPLWSGHYYAPDGVYPLINDDHWIRELEKKTFELIVWADGYVEHGMLLSGALDQDVIEVRLATGVLPGITGKILDDGAPVAGALVALQPYGRLQWSLQDGRSTDMVTTDASGSFALRAPAGDYLLRVEESGRTYAEPITLPLDAERIIDLAHLGQIEVQVLNSSGVPQFEHNVVLTDDTGRSDWLFTDLYGRVTFSYLANGTYQVRVPKVATKGSFGAGIFEDVELFGGGRETLTVTVPAAGNPSYARVVTDLDQEFDGWRARSTLGEWVDLVPDGTVPIDFQELNYRRLLVAAPDGRRWQADVPQDAPNGYEIHITLDGPRYEGVLLDLNTDEPVRGTRISAYPRRPGPTPPTWASSVTDELGRFVLVCSEEVPHHLKFNSRAERPEWDNVGNERFGFGFMTLAPPARNPEIVAIRVPRMSFGGAIPLETRRIRGQVVRAIDGQPVTDARVWITSIQPQPHGNLEIWQGGTMTTGSDGRYDLVVPDVPRYRVNVYGPDGGQPLLTEEWAGLSGADEERDLSVP